MAKPTNFLFEEPEYSEAVLFFLLEISYREGTNADFWGVALSQEEDLVRLAAFLKPFIIFGFGEMINRMAFNFLFFNLRPQVSQSL